MAISTERRLGLLREVALFDDVTDEGRSMIADLAVEVEFGAARPIARQGEIGTGFFLIESGAADVVQDGGIVARLGPGEFFGELSLLDHAPRISSVVAAEPTVCLALPTWDFERLLQREPGLTLAILRVVARRLRQVSTDHRH
jgi:CRP-like cAMP-binding protein